MSSPSPHMQFDARLTAIGEETPTVKSFVLYLEGGQIDFSPGQYIDLFIDAPGFDEAAGYSITSTPLERDSLSIAVKKLPGAKSAIYLHEKAEVGERFFLVGPGGDFFYREEMGRSLVLIAGGIGITPLMSMIRYVHHASLDVNITLLYSAKNPSELAFFDELKGISAHNSNIKCLFTITQHQDEPWEGRVGRVDSNMLRENIVDRDSLFFICGPSELPQDIKESLRELGVDDSRVHAEEW